MIFFAKVAYCEMLCLSHSPFLVCDFVWFGLFQMYPLCVFCVLFFFPAPFISNGVALGVR